MRKIVPICLAALLVLLAGSYASAEQPAFTIQVITDNSGTLQNAEDAKKHEKALFWHLTELRKKRKYKDAIINVVSVNNPRNLFVGTPKQLYRHGQELLPKLQPIRNGCADIAGAFQAVRQNIELSDAKEARLYVFSSLIHAFPCEDVVITLPQDVPANLDLSFLKNTKSELFFFWVHNLQVGKWLPHLKQAGVKNFQLQDEEGTKRVLREGLGDD